MRKYTFELIIGFLELVIIFFGEFNPLLSGTFHISTETMVIALVAVFIFYLTTKLSHFMNDQHEHFAHLTETARQVLEKSGSAEAIFEDDFYIRFPKECRRARRQVSMAHLDVKPPQMVGETGDYYAGLPSLIAGKSDVRYERVERIGPNKQEWIQRLITELGGHENFSLYWLPDGEDRERIPNVSVQLIDEDIVVLVAVAAHNSPQEPRDIWIRDRDIARLWRNYYDVFLKRAATPLIEGGHIHQINYDRLRQKNGW